MYLLAMCIRSISRNRIRSMLLLGVCTTAILLLNVYEKNLVSYWQQMETLPEIFAVKARITNRSGSQDAGLEIDSGVADALRASDYVKDLMLTMQLAGSLKDDVKEAADMEVDGISMRAVNRADALPGFSREDVELMEAADTSFLEGTEAECMVTESFLKKNGLKGGELIRLQVCCLKYGDHGKIEWIYGTEEAFQISGVMKDVREPENGQELPDVVVPFGWAESTLDTWKADSASFVLNLQKAEDLNSFKDEMKEIPLFEIQPAGEESTKGDTLVVQDESFLDAAVALKKQVRMLMWFQPVTAAVTLLTGYVAAWLLAQSQRKEYMLMRLEGVTRRSCFLRFALEHFFLALAGMGIAGMILAGSGAVRQETIEAFWRSGGMFLACYLSGTSAALLTAGRESRRMMAAAGG